MTAAVIALSLLCAALLAACAFLLVDRARSASKIARAADAQERASRLAATLQEQGAELEKRAVEIATLREQARALEENARRLGRVEEQFKDAFKALAGDALKSSGEQLLKLATERFDKDREVSAAELEKRQRAVEQIVKPITETLRKTDEKLALLESQRTKDYATLVEQTRAMQETGARLRDETGKLVAALRKPQVRGRYGEIQLERVCEIAGMRPYCDFETQASTRDDEGRLLRPDLVVRLPNERVIAVDAKTNIDAYLDAMEAESPEDQSAHLERFARAVRDQATALGKKDYWARFDGSPEFVVMFVPGDQFVDAALERQPSLLDHAADRGVIIASPATLIGLLRAVHVGWREKQLSDAAAELFTLGRELHERAATALNHASSVGKALSAAVERYNNFVGSVDARLIPTLRRFEEKGAKSAKTLTAPSQIEATPAERTPPALAGREASGGADGGGGGG